MAFDQTTRNRLARFVSEARALLAEEFTRQLQHEYGLDPASGEMTDLEKLTALDDARRETARILRETLDYYLTANLTPDPSPGRRGEKSRDGLERILREQAFTVLNRLCALRMAEARGLILEAVAQGYRSKGFQLYARLAGSALGETGAAYRSYLFGLFDELALELPPLFDRFSPQGRLFPRESALLKLLDLLDAPDLERLWAEDETIGWIYQYFNSKEERQAMRAASQAPRNSRELAVRNQFFTPRYVVEFLTDNTLGRIWYEMTGGETALKDSCRYLVRRPREVFLGSAPVSYEYIPAWVRAVMEQGDFSALPEHPGLDEIGSLALLIEGYSVGEGFGYGDVLELGSRWMVGYVERGEPFPTDALELWLILFAYQRGRLRQGVRDAEEAHDPYLQGIRAAYNALRQALQNPPQDLSQEELLRQAVFIPHRPLKDPRDIRMLDPACGSMHFGLYAFDLYEKLYAEAWDIEEQGGTDKFLRSPGLRPLHETYPDKAAFLRDAPRLIIEHNIHGIDIDPRAVQIARLSLWLRAQKSWQAQGLKPGERPQIRKSNIVCAEPMPGDQKMLEEFLAELRAEKLEGLMRRALHLPAGQKVRATPAMADALAKLVRTVWQEMELAGEAGSLLKIEETLSEAIAAARKQADEKAPLFRVLEFGLNEPAKGPAVQILAGEEQGFWHQAETLVLASLREYAWQAENGGGYRRRLFAEDAGHGFAFIDLCRKHYDAIVMNPPFGLSTLSLKAYIDIHLEEGKFDLAAVMVQRNIGLLEKKGTLGVLTTRTILSLSSFEDWRVHYLLRTGSLSCVADLGYGVLDAAIVEAAACVIDMNCQDTCFFFNCLDFIEKEQNLSRTIQKISIGNSDQQVFCRKPSAFVRFPAAVIAYTIIDSFARKLSLWKPLESQGFHALKGLNTSDDERYLRTAWEVAPSDIGKGKIWVLLVKGGEWNPFWDDVHLLVNWSDKGRSILLSGGDIRNPSHYFEAGLTYPLRTTSSFGPRVLPSDCIFSTGGLAMIFDRNLNPLCYLGLLLSRVGQLLVEMSLGGGDSSASGTAARNYTNGMINRLPFPLTDADIQKNIADMVERIVDLKQGLFSYDETSRNFIGLAIGSNIISSAREKVGISLKIKREVADLCEQVENFADRIFRLTSLEQNMLSELVGPSPYTYDTQRQEIEGMVLADLYSKSDSDIIELVRAKMGRGSRYITKNSQMVDRKLELISHYLCLRLQIVIDSILSSLENPVVFDSEVKPATLEILSYCMGGVLGRWDFCIKQSTHSELSSSLFSPLPICPPGMLQNHQGLPAAPKDIPANYPLRISWGGILVDDPGHSEDVAGRAREALQVIWNERAEAIEQEACQILGVRSLDEYFRKPGLFFAEHLKRYSKSRRQAPIYWPLATPSGSYTLWLYYHRLSDQTLFTCVNDFVDPKLKQVGDDLGRLRRKSGRSAADEKELERLTDLERELKDLRAELLRVAAFWKPDLNDGVEITAAPLWKLFQHKPWQKRLKETWGKLEAGEYDWAHLAYSIWPERVREKCKMDKSLAIAHGLEEVYVEVKGKKVSERRIETQEEMAELFDEE